MKNTTTHGHQGSAHVIIISILSVALIAALGVLFWQNFVKSEPSEEKTVSKSTTSEQKKKEKTETANPNEGYLVIDSWDVRFKPTNTAKITYEQKNGNYWFTTEKWKNFGGICETNGGVYLIRMVEKSQALASPPLPLNNENKIGNFYYYYLGPQDNCSETNTFEEKTELQKVLDLLSTIEEKK